jgi:hypothetical protein
VKMLTVRLELCDVLTSTDKHHGAAIQYPILLAKVEIGRLCVAGDAAYKRGNKKQESGFLKRVLASLVQLI